MLLNSRFIRRMMASALLPLLLVIISPVARAEDAQANEKASADPDQIAIWVRDLGSPTARKREQATAALIYSGHAATDQVVNSIANGDFEVTYRAFYILASQFSSTDERTQIKAERALTMLAGSGNQHIAKRASKTLADLIARPRAAAIVALQNLGAEVKYGGLLGDPKTPVEVTINEDWFGTNHDLRILRRLHNLQKLHIKIEGGGDEIFAILVDLSDLHTLSLQGMNPTKQGLAQLCKLTGLRSLDLSSTLIDDGGVRQLTTLVNLEHLSLRDTLVTGDSIAHLEQLPKLKSLSLAMTRLTAEEFQQLVAIEKLEHIEVSGTQFTGASLLALAPMNQLRSIAAQQARVSRYDVEDFSELRNNVDVTLASNQ